MDYLLVIVEAYTLLAAVTAFVLTDVWKGWQLR